MFRKSAWISAGCLPWKNPTSTLSSGVREKSSLLPKLSLVIWLQSTFQGPAVGMEAGMVLSVAWKSRTLLSQASGAVTVVFVEAEVGWRKTIDWAPAAGVVPCAKSMRYKVVADST